MHQLIASYLFQNKTCPLPGLGTLSIQSSGAESDFTIHQIAAPWPLIQFSDKETSTTGLLNYVSVKSGDGNASVALDNFCSGLKNEISQNAWAKLEGIGSFVVDNNGNIIFEQSALPAEFTQPVLAERVIHPGSEHTMIVGDRETSNRVMTEYFSETPIAKKPWWIWAIVLGGIILLLLIIYMASTKNAAAFGNLIKI